ncbi:MAG: DUF4013 domain-containing protein [Candidatus Aminicenantes bacterium]|nr:DUF4013 domain-containing protein [Candidatus Aminicenantes bacterium]
MKDDNREKDSQLRLYKKLCSKIKQNPDSSSLHAHLGSVCLDLDYKEEAFEHLKTALELNPDLDDVAQKLKKNFSEHQRMLVRFPEKKRIPFWKNLGAVFSYPLAKRGTAVIFVGAMVFALLSSLPVFGPLLCLVFVYPFIIAYMLNIIRYVADGEEQMPGWPEVSDLWDSIFLPAFRVFFATLICYTPVMVLFILAVRSSTALSSLSFLFGAFFILGTFYYPMALISVAIYENGLAPLNFPVLINAMAKMKGDYILAILSMFVIDIIAVFVSQVALIPIPIVGSFVFWLVTLYFVTVQMYILGNVYYVHEHDLGWF